MKPFQVQRQILYKITQLMVEGAIKDTWKLFSFQTVKNQFMHVHCNNKFQHLLNRYECTKSLIDFNSLV